MILADRLKVPAMRVSATAIGEHGQRIVPVFSRARVEGRRLTLSPQEKEEITQRLREVSSRIVELKGGTEFGPAGTTADLIAALVGPRPRVVPCSVVLQGEYGVQDVAIGVPAVVGTRRVLALDEWPLSNDERAAFDEATRDLKAFADDAAVLLQLVPKPLR